MALDIISKNENKLLERLEVRATFGFDGTTPNRKEIKSHLAAPLGANPELVVLRNVVNEFGIRRLKILAHIYSNPDSLKKNEPRYILVREGLAEKKVKKEKKKATAPPKKV